MGGERRELRPPPSADLMDAAPELAGKIALVTGAGQGNGRAIALALAEAGADLAVNDLDGAAAERVASEVVALGRRALAIRADVSAVAEIEAMVARAGA